MSWKVILAGVCVSLIFGFSFLFTKNALDYVKPLTFLSYRFFVASLFFLFLLIFRAIRLRKKPYWKLWKLIVFQPILYFFFETIGLQRINASEAGMIVALIPIFVNVLAIFLLKEKGDRYHYMLLVSSFLGSILIVGFNLTEEALFGKISMLIAVISAAFYTILSRKLSSEFEPYEISFLMMISGFAFFTLVSKLSGEFRLVLNLQTILGALYLGTLSSAIAFFLLNYMVKHAPSILVSLFSNLTTVVACLAGVLFRNEKISLQQILGVVIVLVSLFVMAYRNREKKVDAAPKDAERTSEEDIGSAIHVVLLEKDLLLTPHAYERMIERGVSLEELKELLESKNSRAFMQKNGRIRISNGSIEAVLQLSGSVLYLVTVVMRKRQK